MRVDQKPIGCLLIEEIISCTHILRVGVAGHEDGLFHANLVAEVAYPRSLFCAPKISSVPEKPVFSTERLWKCVAYTRKPFFAPHAHSVPEKALSGTEHL